MSTTTIGAPTTRTPDVVPVEQLIRAHTGKTISRRAFEIQKEKQEAIRHRLERLARFADDADQNVVKVVKDTLWLVGLMTGEAREVIRLPRRVLFPGSASRTRKDTMTAFCFFLRENPGCRHIIVTCGKAAGVENVPAILREACDKIRRLRGRPWFGKTCEVVMRSAEFTVTNGVYHCHVHLVLKPLGQVVEDDWIELSHKLKRAFGTVVLDDKPITDAYGASQYLFDGNDLVNVDPFELCRLQDLMKHVRTHEPHGSFRALCRELRRTKTKIIWSQNELVKVRRNDGSVQSPQSKSRDEDGHSAGDNPVMSASFADRQPPANFILRITVPFASASRVKEPHLLILNYRGDYEGLLAKNPKLEKFRDELMSQWTAGVNEVGGPPNVHCTVQVIDHIQPEQPELVSNEGVICDLIDASNLQMVGIDPADFLWRPIPRPKPDGYKNDETSFPI